MTKNVAQISALDSSAWRHLNSAAQRKAHEVRAAAHQLIEAIDAWHAWFTTLRDEGDADPAVALRCHELCCAAIEALCDHRVNVAPFNEQTPQAIYRMLPPLSTWSGGGMEVRWEESRTALMRVERRRWQESDDFASYYAPGGRFDTSLSLRAAALRISRMLQRFPLAVLRLERARVTRKNGAAGRSTKKDSNSRSTGTKRASALQLFPQGTKGIDPRVVAFIQHLVAGRDGLRSDAAIAREFTRETKHPYKQARSLLARCRRLRAEDRLNF